MPLLRPLPPQFLLPAWSYRQLHTGPAWVPTFAPKPGPQDEKDSASGAENAQETSPASHVEIKKHLAKKETRAVKASGVKIKKHVAESMRWLPRAEQQSQANNNENTGALKPDNTKSGRDPSGPKSRDGVCSEEPLVSFTPNWNGEQQWAATRQMGQQTNDNEYGSSQRREPFEWFIGPGTTSKPIRTPSKRKSNGRNPQENGCDIRFLAPKKNPTFVFKAADDGQDTRKHLKSSDGGTTRPNPRDDPSGTQVSTDAGDAEMIKTQLDSRRFNRQAATDTETVGTDKMQESRNYSISIPWPVVKPEHSAQGNGNSLSPSINDGSKGDRARAEVESPRREPTLGLNPRNAAWGLSNESQPGPDDAIREPESKSEALKSLAIGEEAPQSQHTSPVANKAKSSTSRAVSLTRDRYPKESSKVEPTRELPAISLLEELFPTEAKRYRREREAVQKPEREVPRLLLSADMADLDDPRGALKRVSRNQAILKNELRLKRLQHLRNFRRREISVLHLLNASKSLTEEDFRRIAPKGKHVEGWMGEGDILKVIPMRDPHTLEPLGEYLLLFSSPSSSHAYWNHVRQQHQLSRVHTPNSLSTQLAPPPGYLVDGQDVHALLQDYALKPPTSQLRLRRLESPLPPHLRNLVNQGGYPELISSETNSSYPILFTVDGAQPSYYDIKQAIHQDGKDRGLMWTALTSKNSIRKFETATPKSEDEADENIFDGREKAPSYARYKPARWILSFQSEAEAQRFVRTWHRREFPLPRGSSTYGEPPPMINAEILW